MLDHSWNYSFFFTERNINQSHVLRDILFVEHDILVWEHLSSMKCQSGTKPCRTDDFVEVIQEQVL